MKNAATSSNLKAGQPLGVVTLQGYADYCYRNAINPDTFATERIERGSEVFFFKHWFQVIAEARA